jgi:hypothetical protein
MRLLAMLSITLGLATPLAAQGVPAVPPPAPPRFEAPSVPGPEDPVRLWPSPTPVLSDSLWRRVAALGLYKAQAAGAPLVLWSGTDSARPPIPAAWLATWRSAGLIDGTCAAAAASACGRRFPTALVYLEFEPTTEPEAYRLRVRLAGGAACDAASAGALFRTGLMSDLTIRWRAGWWEAVPPDAADFTVAHGYCPGEALR